MQVKMGQAIPEQAFQDPLCGSAAECKIIADFRKTVGMGERSRWSAEMIADMQNQEGDTISVIHPESHNAVTVFMTDLRTELLLPETEGAAGHFQQSFEGWRR